jgi:hypothetical protein
VDHPDCAFVAVGATFVIVYLGSTLGNGADVSTSGYVAMTLGVVVSLAVGFGLMALVFYSSRKGYDEAPVLIVSGSNLEESKSPSETR